jgi:uncharacterized protein YjeT (DUF2065 family)
LATRELLIALLTVEGLLFAGASGAIGIAALADNKLKEAGQLALGTAISLTIVAIGCEATWASIFVSHWPTSILRDAGVVCLAIGCALPPAGAWATYNLAF